MGPKSSGGDKSSGKAGEKPVETKPGQPKPRKKKFFGKEIVYKAPTAPPVEERSADYIELKAYQKLPTAILLKYTQKEKRNRPIYQTKPLKEEFTCKCILQDLSKDKEKDLFFETANSFPSKAIAENCAALLALKHLQPTIPQERVLPTIYADKWLSLFTPDPLIHQLRHTTSIHQEKQIKQEVVTRINEEKKIQESKKLTEKLSTILVNIPEKKILDEFYFVSSCLLPRLNLDSLDESFSKASFTGKMMYQNEFFLMPLSGSDQGALRSKGQVQTLLTAYVSGGEKETALIGILKKQYQIQDPVLLRLSVFALRRYLQLVLQRLTVIGEEDQGGGVSQHESTQCLVFWCLHFLLLNFEWKHLPQALMKSTTDISVYKFDEEGREEQKKGEGRRGGERKEEERGGESKGQGKEWMKRASEEWERWSGKKTQNNVLDGYREIQFLTGERNERSAMSLGGEVMVEGFSERQYSEGLEMVMDAFPEKKEFNRHGYVFPLGEKKRGEELLLKKFDWKKIPSSALSSEIFEYFSPSLSVLSAVSYRFSLCLISPSLLSLPISPLQPNILFWVSCKASSENLQDGDKKTVAFFSALLSSLFSWSLYQQLQSSGGIPTEDTTSSLISIVYGANDLIQRIHSFDDLYTQITLPLEDHLRSFFPSPSCSPIPNPPSLSLDTSLPSPSPSPVPSPSPSSLSFEAEKEPETWRVEESEEQGEDERLLYELQGELDSRTVNNVLTSYEKASKESKSLPIRENSNQFIESHLSLDALLLVAETGSGKTTHFPRMILEQRCRRGDKKGLILCSQPRRLAAISIAERVRSECALPERDQFVGYHVRFHKKKNANTRILYLTHGILIHVVRDLCDRVEGGGVDEVSDIIIDEVHERSIQVDILLFLLLRLTCERRKRGLSAPRIILMSGGFDHQMAKKYFINTARKFNHINYQIHTLQIPGRCFPVQQFYLESFAENLNLSIPKSLLQGAAEEEETPKEEDPIIEEATGDTDGLTKWVRKHYIRVICRLVEHLLQTQNPNSPSPGDILIFLPSVENINQVLQALSTGTDFVLPNTHSKLLVLPCHANQSLLDQKKIFDPTPPSLIKVILATNIAESSLTIPNIFYVIDYGRQKLMHFDPSRDGNNLLLGDASQHSLLQRRGRAGRTKSGKYYALFTEAHYRQLPISDPAEILRTSLEDTLVFLRSCVSTGDIYEVLNYLIETPERKVTEMGLDKLKALLVFDEKNFLTSYGRMVSLFPLPTTVAHLVCVSLLFNCSDTVINGVALQEIQVRIRNRDAVALPSTNNDFVNNAEVLRLFSLERGESAKKRFCWDLGVSYEKMAMAARVAKQLGERVSTITALRTMKGWIGEISATGKRGKSVREWCKERRFGRQDMLETWRRDKSLLGNFSDPQSRGKNVLFALVATCSHANIRYNVQYQNIHGGNFVKRPKFEDLKFYVKNSPLHFPREERKGEERRSEEREGRGKQVSRAFIHPSSVNFLNNTIAESFLYYHQKMISNSSRTHMCETFAAHPLFTILSCEKLRLHHDEYSYILLDDFASVRVCVSSIVLLNMARVYYKCARQMLFWLPFSNGMKGQTQEDAIIMQHKMGIPPAAMFLVTPVHFLDAALMTLQLIKHISLPHH